MSLKWPEPEAEATLPREAAVGDGWVRTKPAQVMASRTVSPSNDLFFVFSSFVREG